jgi:hypothetical protein
MQVHYLESKSGRPYALLQIQALQPDDQEQIISRVEMLEITGLEPDLTDIKKLKAYDTQSPLQQGKLSPVLHYDSRADLGSTCGYEESSPSS